jgi:hypothetical protein
MTAVHLEVGMIDGSPARQRRFELRFESLFREGRSYAFPCDVEGHVDLDALSEAARCNYLFARAAMGREYATPKVRPVLEED